MATTRPRGVHLMLLGISIGCSLASLAALILHPKGTDGWRAALNIIALLLVIATTTMLARGGRGAP